MCGGVWGSGEGEIKEIVHVMPVPPMRTMGLGFIGKDPGWRNIGE